MTGPDTPPGWDGTRCAQCGEQHVTPKGFNSCLAHWKHDAQKPCAGSPISGLRTCKMHGSATKASKAKAVRTIALAEAARLLEIAPDVDHRQAVAQELGRAVALEAWLRGIVFGADEIGSLVWGKTKFVDKFPNPEVTEEARTSIWWAMWNGERDRVLRIAKLAHDIGIEERQIAVAEDQAAQLYTVIVAVLAGLGHDLEDPHVQSVLVTQLALINPERPHL